MIVFDLDPSVVRPGWIPLVILVVMGLAMVLLYRSMRRQFRRIDVSRYQGEPSASAQSSDVDSDTGAASPQPPRIG